jgi:hypothetical protein
MGYARVQCTWTVGMKKQLFEKQFGHKPPIGNELGIEQQPAADFRGDFSAS